MEYIQPELFDRDPLEIVRGEVKDLEKAQGNLRRGTFVRLEEQAKKTKDLEMETMIRFEEQNIKIEKLEGENAALKSSIQTILEKLNDALFSLPTIELPTPEISYPCSLVAKTLASHTRLGL